MWVFWLLMVGLLIASLVLTNELRKAPLWRDARGRVGRAWTALMIPARVTSPGAASILERDEPIPAPAPPRGSRWCVAGHEPVAAACQPRAVGRPRRSTMLPEAGDDVVPLAKPTSGFVLASRPGVLVDPAAYGSAPLLPDEGSESWSKIDRSDRSVEVDVEDLEELVDTQPSIVLSPSEAEALREAAHRYDRELEEALDEGRITRSDVPVFQQSPPASSHGGGRKSALPLPPKSSRGSWDKRDTQPRPTPRLDEIFGEAPTGPGRLVRDEDDTQPHRALAG